MLLAEIIYTCTNDKVAEAAVASMGAGYLNAVRRVAILRDMSVGAYVAGLVRRFAWRAGEDDHREMRRVMTGAQTPILAGLRHILETMMDEDDGLPSVAPAYLPRPLPSMNAAA